MNDIYWSGYQDGRFDGYAEAVAKLEEDYKDSENLAAELRAQVSRLQEALAFAQSVIKSGEPWSPTCDEIIGGALAASEGEEA